VSEEGRGVWLLELQIGGRLLRYATRDVTVTDGRDRTYRYKGGLADLSLTLDGLQEQTGLAITDRAVDWALLVRRGEALTRGQATLRYWVPGELLERALVALEGVLSDPEYGDPGKPHRLSLTLLADSGSDRLYPSEQARVDTSTWRRAPTGDTYDEQIEGAIYPTVFGYPGESDLVVDPPVAATPALLVLWDQAALATSYLLLGYGRLDCVGGQAYLRDRTDESGVGYASDWLDVIEDVDDLGQVVTLAACAGVVQARPGHEYYFGLSSAAGKGGGTKVADRSRVASTLTDVAIFCLRYSGRQVDLQAQEGERSKFDRYQIDGQLNERLELVPWFEGELAPHFPLVRARTPHGIYWRWLNWWATAADATLHLDADAGRVVRASSIREDDGSVLNSFTLEFQLNQGNLGARRTLTAEYSAPVPWWAHPDVLDDDRIVGSPACARSQAVYGLREAAVEQSDFIWKESTALAILQHRAVRDSFPRRPVRYTGPVRELRHLTRGDIVTVTDSEVHLDRVVAMVDGVELGGGRLATVALELLDPRRLG
jgi:hypothetical protein